jgi:hypothetical protein
MSALADTLAALARVLDGHGLPWFVVAKRPAPRLEQAIAEGHHG